MPKPSTLSPLPIMKTRLQWIRDAGVPVATVLDAGVQYGTPFLQECFPNARHLLFEPLDQYFSSIEKSYSQFQWELFPVALSDTDGQSWQFGFSVDESGKVQSSRLSDQPASPGEEPNLVSCRAVQRVRLDSIIGNRKEAQPFLLKVDVDGHEMPVLRGAKGTLDQCSIVIVEAITQTIGEKISLMSIAGFNLIDIVDLCYYHQNLSQVDLIFVHKQWVQQCTALRPWQTQVFTWDKWAPLSRNELFSGL